MHPATIAGDHRQRVDPQASAGLGSRVLPPAVLFLLFTNAPGVAVRSHGAPAAVGLAIVLLLAVPLVGTLWRRQEPVLLVPGAFFLLLFLLAQIVSTMFSRYKSLAAAEVAQFVIEGVVLYFLITNVIRTTAQLRAALWAVVLGGGMLGLITIVQWVTGTFLRPYGGFALILSDYLSGLAESPRAAGPLGDPNYYAQILLVPVPLALHLVWTTRRSSLRLLGLGCVAATVAGILLTFSRGAGLGLVAIFVGAVVLRVIRLRGAVVLVAAMLVLLAAAPAYRDRLSTVSAVGSVAGQGGGADESIRSRATEMLAAASVFADHPVAGAGPGVFPQYYQEYAQRIGRDVHEEVRSGPNRGETPQREAHNMFLGLAAETGVTGLLTFCGAIAVTLSGLLLARRRGLATDPDLAGMAAAVTLSLVAYVAAGLFLSLAFERYFWMLLALGAVPLSILRSQEAARDASAGAGDRPPPGRRAPRRSTRLRIQPATHGDRGFAAPGIT